MTKNEDYFTIIGKISIFFSTVDLFATELILKLNSIEANKFRLPKETATLGMKIGFLEDLVVAHPDAKNALDYIYENLASIKKVSNERNRYMHDQWVFAPDRIKSGNIDRIRLTSSGLKETTTLSYSDLITFCNEVGQVQQVFAEAIRKTGVKIA
ncbi:hypothetical protein ND932_15230 [Vibrio diabolicus]|uniref:hypothetical protein n=1 Tax=Vibrio diabolicus TaxID=50719 RepID=UPI00215EEBA1|nr:hypothetical protein [Vibrio diabolicus]MCS0413215.1 hypothetical protein [Vibrio diabolicus]